MHKTITYGWWRILFILDNSDKVKKNVTTSCEFMHILGQDRPESSEEGNSNFQTMSGNKTSEN